MVGEEIIFNFDILIFLVISIGSWVFALAGGMPILRGKKSERRFPLDPPTPLILYTAVLSCQQWPKRCEIISLTE